MTNRHIPEATSTKAVRMNNSGLEKERDDKLLQKQVDKNSNLQSAQDENNKKEFAKERKRVEVKVETSTEQKQDESEKQMWEPRRKERLSMVSFLTSNPSYPSFQIIMAPSYTTQGPHIPSNFSMKYLKDVSSVRVEVSGGTSCVLGCRWPKNFGTSVKFTKGWLDFVCMNELKTGDVCLFDLLERDHAVLKATFFLCLDGSSDDTQHKVKRQYLSYVSCKEEIDESEKHTWEPQINGRLSTNSIQTNNPCFQIIMAPSYSRNGPHIPSCFATKYLKNSSSVRTGDVFVFELLETDNVVLKATFFRSSAGSSDDNQNNIRCKRKRVMPSVMKKVAYEGTEQTLQPQKNGNLSISSITQTNNGALHAATKYIPSYPFFQITVTPSTTTKGPHIPSYFVRKYLMGTSLVRVEVPGGTSCVLGLSWPKTYGYSVKLTNGWLDFALRNKLKAGDVCLFELLESDNVALNLTSFETWQT